MTRLRALAASTALMLAPLPAWAQQGAGTFAAQAAPVDPARLTAARPVVASLFPDGTYKRMMGESMSKLMDSMVGGAMELPLADIARIADLPPEQVAAMDKAKLGEVAQIVDPYFRERMSRGMNAMFAEMGDLFSSLEPKMREGLARAYARKFDVAQLDELNRFFSTPTGARYAHESMLIYMDPEVMTELQGAMPEIMKQMPRMVKAMEKATKDLPPPRKAQDLTEADKKKIADLLGLHS